MKHYKLLMVDDDREFLEEFETILSGHGFDVHLASTGREAVEKAKALQPALILMDKKLPDADGQLLIKEIKTFCKKTVS